jgi:hypothetical protein
MESHGRIETLSLEDGIIQMGQTHDHLTENASTAEQLFPSFYGQAFYGALNIRFCVLFSNKIIFRPFHIIFHTIVIYREFASSVFICFVVHRTEWFTPRNKTWNEATNNGTDLLQLIRQKQVDVVVSDITITSSKTDVVTFTIPLLTYR